MPQRQVALDISLWPLSNVLVSKSPCFQLLPWAREGRGGGCAEDEKGSCPWHYTRSPYGGAMTPPWTHVALPLGRGQELWESFLALLGVQLV